jgi:hypothetical protein
MSASFSPIPIHNLILIQAVVKEMTNVNKHSQTQAPNYAYNLYNGYPEKEN